MNVLSWVEKSILGSISGTEECGQLSNSWWEKLREQNSVCCVSYAGPGCFQFFAEKRQSLSNFLSGKLTLQKERVVFPVCCLWSVIPVWKIL